MEAKNQSLEKGEIEFLSPDVERIRFFLTLLSDEIPRLEYDRITEIGDRLFYVVNGMKGTAKNGKTVSLLEDVETLVLGLRLSLRGNNPTKYLLDPLCKWTDKNKREWYNMKTRKINKVLDSVSIVSMELTIREIAVEFERLERFMGDELERRLHCDIIYSYCDRIAAGLIIHPALSRNREISRRIDQIRNRLLDNLTNLQTEPSPEKRLTLLNKIRVDYNKLEKVESLKEFGTEQLETLSKSPSYQGGEEIKDGEPRTGTD